MTIAQIPHVIRPAEEGDLNFIRSSWLRTYATSNFRRYMTREVYYTGHGELVDDILQRCNALIAANPEDPSQIYAYIVFELYGDVLVLHFVYVKDVYRKLGFCGKLISLLQSGAKSRVTISSHANECFRFIDKKYNVLYNPYFLWRKK